MPIRRTPPRLQMPASPAASEPNEPDTPSEVVSAIVWLSGSAPNLSHIEKENVNTRKRKREDDLSSFMQEMRDLLQSSTAQSETKYLALQNSMKEIIAQNAEIKNSLNFVSQQYDELKDKIKDIEIERKAEKKYINQLEDKVENLERILCLTKIEVRNIPKKEGENKEDLRQIIAETASVLQMSLERQDIKDIFRVYKKYGTPSIIVEFGSVTTKENMLDKVRQYNRKNNQHKLNTAHIKIKGETKPIYLSECLTQKSQRLFHLARKYATDNGFKFCWTSNGKIFLRQSEGQKHILVKSEADLKINRAQ
ncbi:hypothetical protein PYW08_000518 [Mythimna loreyi]|uniref:Uncharacterized protein n=1 Tax=Mythimna loreyi TaxID=667449 RepID=A0ACC2RCP5_9NEOP|nr:hypothetical protein PYW08_000518 [Mythimna loreyi]